MLPLNVLSDTTLVANTSSTIICNHYMYVDRYKVQGSTTSCSSFCKININKSLHKRASYRCLIRLILYCQCYVFYVPALQDNVLQISMHLCHYLAGDCLDLHCVLPSAVISILFLFRWLRAHGKLDLIGLVNIRPSRGQTENIGLQNAHRVV